MDFKDRKEAARTLAAEVRKDNGFEGIETVVGLARGGVVIAHEVAREGGLPLCTLLVDDNQERRWQIFVSPFGNAMVRRYRGLKPKERMFDSFRDVKCADTTRLFGSVLERQLRYSGSRPQPGKSVLLCDDGLVSGKTARFACRTLREFCGIERIVVAVPVIPRNMAPADIWADEIIFVRRSTLERPPTGLFYREFDDVTDEEVIRLSHISARAA